MTSGTPLARKQACPESPGCMIANARFGKTFIISLDYMTGASLNTYCVDNANIFGSHGWSLVNYIPGSSAEGP